MMDVDSSQCSIGSRTIFDDDRLAECGAELIGDDAANRVARAARTANGAIWADSPRALATEADVIFSSLPEPSDVEAVALGADGLIAGIKPGAAYFDLSTNSPSVVKKLNTAFAERGAHMLPMTQMFTTGASPIGERSKAIQILCAGAHAVLRRARQRPKNIWGSHGSWRD